ncbi:NYN domain-containing protein [Cupriavidus agavae]|uniref:NYN domain-containing protein n=1 Tax=Cupriavidus agavae TaxID=1001822 RepID=A0A4Q7RRQ1_9BURK|nr:NYN domain-containing protein [Cupriavidus agavae]RZT36386.1 NYN domain-containing protein [Cupriavidus agavae]
MPTGILIDGAFFIKRYRDIYPSQAYDAAHAANCAYRWALAHLEEPWEGAIVSRDLYRIFFYDCPPLEKKLHNPISKRAIAFGVSEEAVFRRALHAELRCKRKVAVRLGHLSSDTSWTIQPARIQELLKRRIGVDDLRESDVRVVTRQKGVDMRIGLDVSSLAFKRQVRQIVLIAGDADFIPAAKLARREGVDFIVDTMWQGLPKGLEEHVDGVRSTCPEPPRKKCGSAGVHSWLSPAAWPWPISPTSLTR